MSSTITLGREITLTLSWDDPPPTCEVSADVQTASGALEVALRLTGGRLQMVRDIEVGAEALVHFEAALAGLLEELNGEATLEPWPDVGDLGDFALTLTLSHGKGTVSGFVATTHGQARLTFSGIEIDQSYLTETQRQLRMLLDCRPA